MSDERFCKDYQGYFRHRPPTLIAYQFPIRDFGNGSKLVTFYQLTRLYSQKLGAYTNGPVPKLSET